LEVGENVTTMSDPSAFHYEDHGPKLGVQIEQERILEMRPIDFGYDLGPVSAWGQVQRRIATAAVRACLIEPLNGKRRVRVRQTLLAAELKMLEREALAEPPMADLVAAVKADLVGALVYIARQPAKRYLAKGLSFDLDEKNSRRKMGKNMPEIVATGLIVEVVHEAAQPGQEQTVGIDAAKETIRTRFKKNAWFKRHETGLAHAWTQYRPMAHLAAANLRFVWDRDLRRFGGDEVKALRANIVAFLETANYFQHYIRTLSVQPKLRFTYDLAELPPWLNLGRKRPEGDLVVPEGMLA
jgi:hypothetical protein